MRLLSGPDCSALGAGPRAGRLGLFSCVIPRLPSVFATADRIPEPVDFAAWLRSMYWSKSACNLGPQIQINPTCGPPMPPFEEMEVTTAVKPQSGGATRPCPERGSQNSSSFRFGSITLGHCHPHGLEVLGPRRHPPPPPGHPTPWRAHLIARLKPQDIAGPRTKKRIYTNLVRGASTQGYSRQFSHFSQA